MICELIDTAHIHYDYTIDVYELTGADIVVFVYCVNRGDGYIKIFDSFNNLVNYLIGTGNYTVFDDVTLDFYESDNFENYLITNFLGD